MYYIDSSLTGVVFYICFDKQCSHLLVQVRYISRDQQFAEVFQRGDTLDWESVRSKEFIESELCFSLS
jgi:hypothetical protein